MATTKAAGSGTTKTAKKTPARAPNKQVASKPAAGNGAARGASAKAAPGKTATAAGTASRVTATKASAKKMPATKAATPRVPAAKPAAASPPATRSAGKSVPKAMPRTTTTASAAKSRKISPEQALANTRGLLEAKREHARQPQSWQAIGPSQGHPGSEGFQSPGAMDKAEELHAAESRITPIQGSISTHDRHNQGKRDSR